MMPGWVKWVLFLILDWAKSRLLPPFLTWLQSVKEKIIRASKQKKAQEIIDDNVKQEKPRDDQTRKDEKDWLNS